MTAITLHVTHNAIPNSQPTSPALRTPSKDWASCLEFKWGFLSEHLLCIISHQASLPCSKPVILIVISPIIIHQSALMRLPSPPDIRCLQQWGKWVVWEQTRDFHLAVKKFPPELCWRRRRRLTLHENIHANESPRSQEFNKIPFSSRSLSSAKACPFIYICNLDM